jgi:hypothetical protein
MTRVGERARLGRWFESLAVASRPLQRRLAETILAFNAAIAEEGRGSPADCADLETRSFPKSLAATRRGFTFYLANPVSSIPQIHQEIRSEIIRVIRVIRGSPAFDSCLLVSIRGWDQNDKCRRNDTRPIRVQNLLSFRRSRV